MNKLLRIVILSFAVFYIAGVSSDAGAVTASDWRAGNIIDDTAFTDKSSMSVSQIQSWLDTRLSNCDYNGAQTSEISGGTDYNRDGKVTRAEYGKTRGNPAPFTCLNKYYEVPKLIPGPEIPKSNYGSSTIPNGAKSAAQLIYDAAQTYNISPEVLLVKLGTESAGPLTSDPWPFKAQYAYAMGAHCPDSGEGGSANCDTDYSGFSLQMRKAAELLRWYLDSMDKSWWSYKTPYATNNILWNVQPSNCGGSNVYIENKATAALYTYTPYQPNSAALNNMYGEGNSCSAYGNRNFWRVYNDWFGSTWSSPFISYNGTVYIEGIDSSYYRVPNSSVLKTYGHGTIFKSIRSVTGSYFTNKTNLGDLPLVVKFEGSEIYAVSNSSISHFGSRPLYEDAYGYTIGQEAQLSQSWLARYKKGAAMQPVLKVSGSSPVYFVEAKQKRHISSPTAYKTLGSPVYSSQPSITLSSVFVDSIQQGPPVLATNIFVRASDTNRLYFWDGTMLHELSGDVASSFGNKVSYSTTSVNLLKLPKSSSTISRYAKSSTGVVYMVYSNKKVELSSDDLTKLSKSSSSVPTAPDALLNLLSSLSYADAQLLRFGAEPAVFRQLAGNNIYWVFDRYDLSKFDLSLSSTVSLPKELAPVFTNNGAQFSQKRLIQINGNHRVYLSDNTSRSLYYIPSSELASQYGVTLVNIAQVSSLSDAPSYSATDSLSRRVKDASGNYWLIDGKARHPFPVTIMTNYQYSMESFDEYSNSFIGSYPQSPQLTIYLRDKATGKVYKIINGTKRWYSTREKFEQDTSWANVRNVSPEYLTTIPSGLSI